VPRLSRWTAAATSFLVVAVAPLVAGADSTTTTSTPATTSTATTSTSTTSTSTTTSTTGPPVREVDPFNVAPFARYLEHRGGVVTAAVYDVDSGRTYLYDSGVHERTASIVKIDILATALYQSQEAHRSFTARQQEMAAAMIEDSNDHDATLLWNAVGGRDAIDDFNTMIGFHSTIPSWSWGDIETTPRDQLQLLKAIVLPNDVLDTASRDYEMGLMEGVVPSERFGLGWGSPARALVGVKDGYYLEATTGWQLNTTGFVRYQGRFYLATVMTASNPDEEYGIDTVTTVSRDIWRFLKP
jgi:hypothetical protein